MKSKLLQMQLTISRAEKIQLNMLISDFHSNATYEELRPLLKKVLKSNIGSIIMKKPKRADICSAVKEVCHLFRFAKELLSYSIEDSDLDLRTLLNLANSIKVAKVEEVVMECLNTWIKDFSDERLTLSVAESIYIKFRILKLFIDECEILGNILQESEVTNA